MPLVVYLGPRVRCPQACPQLLELGKQGVALSGHDSVSHVQEPRTLTCTPKLHEEFLIAHYRINALYENLLNSWDPLLFFDSHRMGSGNVAYGIGCSNSTIPAAHPGPRGYVWEELFPAVFDGVRREYKVEAFTHALWMEDEWPPRTWHYDGTIWAVDAKFAVNAYGLRNRMSILCETPGAASFERQVFAQYAWISTLLEFTNAHGDEMMEVAQAADEETVQRVLDGAESGELRNWVDGEYQSWGPIDILAYRDAFPSAPREYLPGTS
jgi:hypothetical protein